MDNIISNILDIDKSARDKISAAEADKNRILAQAKTEEERIINERLKQTDDMMKKIEEDEKAQTDAKIAEIEKNKNDEILRLDRIYSERHENWENKIFSSVISSANAAG